MSFRFFLEPDTPLRPVAIAGPSMRSYGLPSGVRLVDALDKRESAYCWAMNRANCLAYDGQPRPGDAVQALGMPPWVMLDCCILPSAVFGYEVPRAAVPGELAAELDPTGTLEWIAVSEYIAVPTVQPGEVIGVSLFSLVRGAGLGTRTKALALRALNARRQIGVTQWTSPGVLLHLRFGPLEVLSTSVAIHSRADETFVYVIQVRPDDPHLGGRQPRGEAPEGFEVLGVIDPREAHPDALAGQGEGRLFILDAGPVVDGKVSSLTLGRRRG